ncbi:MAG: cell division protein FtsZ [Sphingomonadales bacterium]|jgi:cell division protein FtsZ|nr:cell division protein FtsZ [Sphingomonadales bacterium]
MIEFASDLDELRPRITVIGVGGAGGNAVANMMAGDVTGVDFVVANTDAQALQASPASRVMQLGRKTTQGLGAGSRADLGRAAAEESIAEIDTMLEGVHMCFIAAGLGGGTGTGAAPVIAKAARDKGILTVGVVTKPFAFEGLRRARIAELGLEELQLHVDTLLVIPNQNLFRIAGPDTTFKAAFDLADEVLQQGVRGITDLMTMPGMINLDFADVRTIMANRGKAMMGSGEASGDDRAIRATEQAISNPLLDDALKGARGLIISITGGSDLRLMEVDEVAQHIKDMVDPDADIIWGSAFNADLEGRIRVSVVATGVDTVALPQAQAAPQFPPIPAQAAATRIAALRPIEAFVPQQTELGLARAAAAQPVGDETPHDELLLTVEGILTLVPPEGVGEFATLDPFAVEAATVIQIPTLPIRGPSLFERMAMVARGKGRDVSGDAPPFGDFQRGGECTNQRIARVA